MAGHGSKIGFKTEEAIAALMTHRNHDEAAKTLGISPRTLRRWRRQPEFAAAFLLVRKETAQLTNARIQHNSGVAASVLLKQLADPSTPPGVKARVALGLLEITNKSLVSEDLELRIAALEQAGKSQK
jgi:transposase-like protein